MEECRGWQPQVNKIKILRKLQKKIIISVVMYELNRKGLAIWNLKFDLYPQVYCTGCDMEQMVR